MPLRQSYKEDADIKAGEVRACVKEPVILNAVDAAAIIQFIDSRVNKTDRRWMIDVLMRGSKDFRE